MKKLGMILMLHTAILALFPFTSYAQDDLKSFKKSCVKAWMNKSKSGDSAEFKSYGEKYCDCVASQAIDTDAQMESAAKLCMSRVLLREAMNALQENGGLSNLNTNKIEMSCVKRWDSIATALAGDSIKPMDIYCRCAAPKLLDLSSNRDSYTETTWAEKIDSIADSCAGYT